MLGRLFAVLPDNLRPAHLVDLGAEYIQQAQDHYNQIQSFVPVPDPFPNRRANPTGKLDLLVLTQELQEKFFIESPALRIKMNTARLSRLDPELVRQLLLVMADIGLEKAAMRLR